MYYPALENLIRLLGTLPGIGRRSATRIAFHLLHVDADEVEQLSGALRRMREEVHFCQECGGLTDRELCEICEDTGRDDSILCVVEEPNDIYVIEGTGEYRGRYHVLNGALSPMDGIGPEDLRLEELRARILAGNPRELFIATNPTIEGDATARYLADLFQDRDLSITRISHGIPTGSAIEFAEMSALARSIRSRRALDD